jgi:hypothetical protein
MLSIHILGSGLTLRADSALVASGGHHVYTNGFVLTQVVDTATSTVALTSSLNPSTSRQSVTFTATVSPEFGVTRAGNVTFKDGTAKLATVTLAGGMATFTTSALTSGTHTMSAKYGGSADFSASSTTLLQTVH